MKEKKAPDMIKVNDEVAKKLIDTIIEVETSEKLLNEAKRDVSFDPRVFKTLMEYHVKALKEHRQFWMEVLVDHVGEDFASEYRNLYKFDIYMKVIFIQKVEGCSLT